MRQFYSHRDWRSRSFPLIILTVAVLLFNVAPVNAAPQAVDSTSGPAILEQLHGFQELRSVLHIAAHPDDENTQLLTYLARGRHVRTAYLSLTRGDGGQNVLGPEFGDELGLIRTNELLAARHLDGGQQFFTRAIDFGFSKDYRETLKIWDEQTILSDVVRVIRQFQPDVIITRFSPEASKTHGHHTASAVLALEAFKLCGDPKAFPEQLKELSVWQPKRIMMNAGGFPGQARDATGPVVKMDVNGNDPLLKESFADIAAESRAMHKSQGFGNFAGGGGRGGQRSESFQLLAGEPADKDIFDGVDTTWNRISGGREIGKLADGVVAKFDLENPAASVPSLLELRSRLAALPDSPLAAEKRRQLDQIIQACLGLSVETTVDHAEVVPGESVALRQTAKLQADVPVRWLGAKYLGQSAVKGDPIELRRNQEATREVTKVIPSDAPISQPYWLQEHAAVGNYNVADKSLIGSPENPPEFPIEQVFEVRGQKLSIADEPCEVILKSSRPDSRRRLAVVAPVTLAFDYEVKIFAPDVPKPVNVQVTAVRGNIQGQLKLDAPTDWKVTPQSKSFQLDTAGQTKTLNFTVTPPPQAATAIMTAVAEVNGTAYHNRRVEIHYEHLPPLLLQPSSELKAVALDMAIRGQQVGYLPGAGDSVAECLTQMGYSVKTLTGNDLTKEGLHGLDAIVIGVRAFNVRDDLVPHLPALFEFAESGGNVIVQYNRPNGLKTEKLAPYDLRLSQDRVTDEQSPVTFLAPDHPVLNTPNRITKADFEGWVQERGIYFPDQWDEHFTPILECNDPGESPPKGGILVAKVGRGNFIYTSLVWFRELPAGVPGAYRLFANLVSLGKE
jgi:LmbE family N-acetylglucosaminyl deacetylase